MKTYFFDKIAIIIFLVNLSVTLGRTIKKSGRIYFLSNADRNR